MQQHIHSIGRPISIACIVYTVNTTVDAILTMRMERRTSRSMMMETYAPMTILTIAATGND